jgi:fructose-bisphosphate aldolase class I
MTLEVRLEDRGGGGARGGDALVATASRLVSSGRGVLAIDESPKTLTERFGAFRIPSTPETRTRYREVLCSTPDLARSVSGVILHRETFRAVLPHGQAFPAFLEDVRLLAGVKVDTGTSVLPGNAPELVTEGLDGLAAEARELRRAGASFAKWRAVLRVGEGLPSKVCLVANATALARYALACQSEGLVPIVEPEVLMDGDHDLERCALVTEEVLATVFAALRELGVVLEGMILKPSMVLHRKRIIRIGNVAHLFRRTHPQRRGVP